MAKSKTSRNDTMWYPIIFMTVLAFVMVLILALLDYSTKDRIELQQKAILNQKILYAMNIPYENQEQVDEIFKNYIEIKPIDFMDTSQLSLDANYYVYKEGGEVKAYAFPITGKALWGTVDAIVVLDKELRYLLGMDIVTHSETPGLGGRIEENWYKEQFRNIELVMTDGKFFDYPPQKGANIDVITGATLTSVSMRDLLNDNVKIIKENFKGGQ